MYTFSVHGQVNKGEYFFDADPGVGNGFNIPVSSSADSVVINQSIPVAGLSSGFHTVYVRARLSKHWSQTESKSFFITTTASVSAGPVNGLEYFFDADPGIGLGTKIAISPAADSTVKTAVVPVSGLSTGFHTLYIRPSNNQGFGMTEARSFFIISGVSASAGPVNGLEYFFDADPGVGLGTKIAISPAADSSVNTAIVPVSGLSAGFHTMYIRAKNEKGFGISEARSFFIMGASSAVSGPVSLMEYFVDTDPGLGLGTSIGAFTAGDSVEISRVISLPNNITLGSHKLYIRCKTTDNRWAITEVKDFDVACGPPEITSTQTQICPGASTVLSSVAGNAPGTYQWLRNNQPINNANSFSFTATQTGNYRLIFTNGTCADTSAVISIGAGTGISATNVASGPLTFCAGGSVSLTANSGTGLLFQWLNNGAVISNATTQTLSNVNASGSYSVVVTNSSGCKDTSNLLSVLVHPKPNPTIGQSGTINICQGQNTSLSVSNPVAGQTYQWKNGAAVVGTNPTFLANASGNYRVVITNTFGCKDSSGIVVVNTLPAPNASVSPAGSVSVCQPASITLTATVTPGSGIKWLKNGIEISGQTASTLSVNAAGSYAAISTLGAGCADTSATVVVTVNPGPTASIVNAGSASLCQGNSTVLKANKGAGLSYQWQKNGLDLPGKTQDSLVVNSAGNYTVSVQNAFSCSVVSNSIAINLVNESAPVVTALGNVNFCIGGSVNLQSSSASSVQWQKNGVDISAATSATFTATTSGEYRVKQTISSCTVFSNTIQVNVNSVVPATPVVSSGGQTSFCQNGSLELLSSASGENQWFVNGTPVAGNSNSITATQGGVYTVQAISNGCKSLASAGIAITVKPNPVVNLTAPSAFICPNSSVLISASGSALASILWFRNGANTGIDAVNFSASQEGNYSVIATGNNGCEASSNSINLTKDNAPLVSSNVPVNTICAGNSITLSVSSGAAFLWNNGSTNPAITVSPSISTEFSVRTTSVNACIYRDTIQVQVLPSLSPAPVSAMVPEDGSINQETSFTLSWQPGANAISYDLYVWEASLPSRPATPVFNTSQISFNLSGLSVGTIFNWQVVSRSACQLTNGPVQQFTTRNLPDLVVSNVQSQAVIGIPGLLNVTYSVKNQGTGVTIPGVWLDKLFLSNDSVIGNDIELDSKANLNALMPGASYNGSFQIETSRLGEFFLYVQTDKDLSIRESNETNNITFRNPGKIQLISQITSPDVVGIGSAFVPSTAVGGQTFSLSYKVRNQGTANALGTASIVIPSPQICQKLDPYWTDLVYISHDSIFNSNAIQIGTVLVNPRQLQSPVANNPDGCNDAYLQTDPRLKIDSSVVVFSNSSLIPHTFYGKGYIYVQLNGGTGMFTELIKENNLIRSNEFNVILRPPADLEVRSILINPISTQSGDSVRLKYQIRNVGLNAPLAIERPWTDNVYLSKSPVFNKSTAILLKSSSPLISNFPPNGTYSDSVDFAVPFLGKNPLFFFVETDATQKVFEYSFETNNINSPGIQLAVDTTKKPDYIVQSLTGPGNLQAGTNLDFSFQVKNIGNANGLGFVRLNYFLRSVENNQLFSLPYQDISPIKLGQSLTVNASELVPFFIPGGNYNLVVKVDELASQVELNENNNSAQIPLQVATGTSFDIGISAVTAPDTIDIFQNQPSFQVSAQGFFNTIQPGPGMPKSCNVSIEIWDKTNPNIRYLTRSDLLSFSDSFPANFAIPARTITRNTALIGQYKLRVSIAENFAQDVDQTNQTFERNIFFRTSPVPDMVFAQTPATISLTAGAAFRIPIVIKNTGVNELQGVCVSRAALSNSPAGTEIISGGIIGSSQQAAGISNLPTNVLVKDTIRGFVPLNFAGNYFLVLEVDADKKTFEGPSGESNNLLVLPVTIASPVYPDLVADPLVLPANVEAGRRLNISYVLRNQGSGQFSGISKNTFRFSKTGVFNPFSDGEIGSVNQQLSLNPGTNQTFNASVVASGILPGNYKPGTFVNSNFQNSESNFANNESYATGFRNLFINPLALDVQASESGFQGDYFYRSVAIGQGLDILAEFQGASGYASKDKVPVASTAEFSSPEDGSTELIIPSSESGTYYFGIRPSSSGPVGLKVRALPFSILSISPNKVGQGNATCEVKGAAYNTQTLFLLLNGTGQVVDTAQIRILRNSMQARVTFHCKNLALGFYTVRAIKAGLDTFDLVNGLQVVPKSPTGIIIQDDVPSVVTAGSTLPITYRFLNAGNTDVENGFGQIIVAGFTNVKNIVVSSNAVGLNGLVEKTGVFTLGGSIHQEEMDMFNFIPAWKRNMGPNEEFQISMELERFGSINSLPIFRTAQDLPDSNFHQMMAEQVEKLRWISIQKLNKISNQQILDSLGGYWSFQRLAYQNLRSSGFFRQSDMDSIEAHPYYPSLLQPNEMKGYGIIFNPVAIRNLSLKYLCFAPLSEYNLPADSSLYLDVTDGILHSYSSAFRRTPQDLIQSACNGDSVEFKRRLGNRFLSLPTGKNRGGGLVGNLNDGFVFGPCIYSTIFGEYKPNAQARSGGGINSTQSGFDFQGDGGNFNPVDRCPGCFDDEGQPQAPTPVPPPAPPTGPPPGRDRDLSDFQPPATKLPSPSCAAATFECTTTTDVTTQRCGKMYTVCTLTLCDVTQAKFAGCFPYLNFFDQKCTQVRYSCDPNEIDGPDGFGKSQFVAKTDTLPFTILFENDPVFATAAAGMVRVIQPLDINVKASALRLKQFGFGNQIFDVPAGQNSFTSEIDLSADRGIKVSVLGTIDILNRQLFWQFTTLDASTGLPSTNPDKGFLPVNDSTGKGEGFVSYTIMADSTTQTGDSLRAQAEIFFDFNEPIITNRHFNIVDANPPATITSSSSGAQDSTTVAFSWTATDDVKGSGAYQTQIMFKKDNGSLDSLRSFPADTGTVLISGFETGHVYQFFFRSSDNVGNQEALPDSANMVVSIGGITCNDPAPTISAGGPLTFCEGRSVVLTSDKPTGNIWSNGETTSSITVSASGIFTVKTLIDGCTSATSLPVTVNVNPLPVKPVVSVSGPATFCQGGSVTLTTNAALGHKWSNGAITNSITVSNSGTFSDTAIALGCKNSSDPIVITVNPKPSVNAGPDTSIDAGETTILTATGATTYVWSPLLAINPANGIGASVSVNPIQTTLYSVTGTDANNCVNSDQVLVTVTGGSGSLTAPVISPSTGSYSGPQLVTITSTSPGAEIYFTRTGNTPVIGTVFTKLYTGPFTILESETIRAMAVKSGQTNSKVAVSFLTITDPGIVAAPVFNPGAGNFEGSVTVSIASATPGADIWYTTNGNNPRLDIPNSFTKLYTGSFTIFTSSTIKVIATKPGVTNSKLVSGNFVISNSSVVANPTFSPAPGSYPNPQTITISTASPDAQIFYTTNGNTPRFDVPNSFTKTYTGPLTISSSVTLKAVARKTGFVNSGTSVGNYSIGPARIGFDEESSNFYFETEDSEEILMQPNIRLLPNPSKGRCVLISENINEPADISIINMLGQTIWKGKMELGQNQIEIDITQQPVGIYTVLYQSKLVSKESRITKQ
jgi:hypothetical protein